MNCTGFYFRVDEYSEPMNALFVAKEFLQHPSTDLYHLKWTLLALHNALQGFMILALKGTSCLEITKIKKKDTRTQVEILSDSNRKVLNFIDLYEMLKKDSSLKCFDWVQTDEPINTLNSWRNQFVHYMPMSWSIETMYIKNVLISTLKLLVFLVENHPNIARGYSNTQISEIKKSISDCTTLL